jgi:hypothetical protein
VSQPAPRPVPEPAGVPGALPVTPPDQRTGPGGGAAVRSACVFDDVVDRHRHGAVLANFRTDGTWVWTDTVAYYLEQHHLAPEEELLAHIRAAGYRVPALGEPARRRVLASLQRPVGVRRALAGGRQPAAETPG